MEAAPPVMTTGLWAAVAGVSDVVVTAAIPPACRRGLDRATTTIRDDQALVETPVWAVAGATHLVPSFSALTDAPFSVRLEITARVGGAWSPWVAGVGLGPAPFAPLPDASPLAVDVDVFRAQTPVEAVRVRARVQAPAPAAVLDAPWLLTLSAAESGSSAGSLPGAPRGAHLAVPALSQMECDERIAHRICSPTCVAMVLEFWRQSVPVPALAAEMFHPGTDLYGVWPAAIMAAGRHGLAGYVLRVPDWDSAAWCLEQGLPVIASVRYGPGELPGAAIAQTTGHLMVLTGVDGHDVLVNDPAAPSAAAVRRRYPLAAFARIWLTRTAIAYVLFPPTPRT